MQSLDRLIMTELNNLNRRSPNRVGNRLDDFLDDEFAANLPRGVDCTPLNQRQCRLGPACGVGNSGICSWLGPNRRCVCVGSGLIPGPYPRSPARFQRQSFDQYFDQYTDALDDIDALDEMIDQATQDSRRPPQGPRRPPIRGGRGGRVRTGTSPWPSLLNQATQAIRTAIAQLNPLNVSAFNNALYRAESLLNSAGAELRRVTSGARQRAALDQLSNAVIRIQVARSSAGGGSAFVPGGRSLIPPETSLQGAINHIQNARGAIGLQSV